MRLHSIRLTYYVGHKNQKNFQYAFLSIEDTGVYTTVNIAKDDFIRLRNRYFKRSRPIFEGNSLSERIRHVEFLNPNPKRRR